MRSRILRVAKEHCRGELDLRPALDDTLREVFGSKTISFAIPNQTKDMAAILDDTTKKTNDKSFVKIKTAALRPNRQLLRHFPVSLCGLP